MKNKSPENHLNQLSWRNQEDINRMTIVCAALLWKLHSRGLKPGEIHQLVKDTINILKSGGAFTNEFVNSELEALGWPKQIIDARTFQLIISLLEDVYDYQIEAHTLH